jgi:cytochrome o ubiquinol oxidase subunit II
MVVLNPTGDIARQERDLILVATGLMLLIVLPVLAMIVLFAWRYRRGNSKKNYDPSFHHSTKIELVIWSCPLLIIICLGVVTWTSTHLLDPFRPLDRIASGQPIPPGTKPLEVQVVALDWKWLFIYPEQGIASINELTVPVNVPVRFSITSADQFNTFYAPTMAGMIYAMPGMKSMLNAVLNEPGDSWGYSGNYTGAGYSDMRFQLHGVSAAGFGQWVKQIKAGGGGTLDRADYLKLEQPSEKAPVTHFTTVSPGLFNLVVNQCVEPGKPCMVDVMRHDSMADNSMADNSMADNSMASAGDPSRMNMAAHPMAPCPQSSPSAPSASCAPRGPESSSTDQP